MHNKKITGASRSEINNIIFGEKPYPVELPAELAATVAYTLINKHKVYIWSGGRFL